jgi:hypothetical protein
MAGSCEHGNEQARSIHGALLFHPLSDSAPFRILEVPGWNLNQETDYAEVFRFFPQSLLANGTTNEVMAAFFHILSTSLFADHPIIQRFTERSELLTVVKPVSQYRKWTMWTRRRTNKRIVACWAVATQRPRDRYTRAVSSQRLGQHVPAAIYTNATMIQERNGVYCVVRVKGY